MKTSKKWRKPLFRQPKSGPLGRFFCLAARGPEAPGPAKRRRPPGRLGDAGPQAIGIAPGKWPLSLARSLVPLYNNLVFIYFAFP